MSEENLLVAFDISDQCVRAAAGRTIDNQIEVLAVEQKSYRTNDCVISGQIKRASDVAYTLSACANLLNNRLNGQKIHAAFVTIGGAGMRTIRVTGRRESGGMLIVSERLLKELAEETIRKTIEKYKEEGQNICVIEHQELRYWMDEVEKRNITSQKGKIIEIEYLLTIAPTSHNQEGSMTIEKNYIANLERVFAQTGLSIEKVFLKSDALAKALLENEETKEGCALIDFGYGSTGLSIYKDDKLQFAGYVPIGGKHITADISSLGISFNNAEKLKCKYGQALLSAMIKPYIVQVPSVNTGEPVCKIDTRLLNQIIEARQCQALAPIVKQINQSNVQHLIITGEGAKLRDLNTLLQEKYHLFPRLGSHDVWITQGLQDEPAFSLLVGTMILGMNYRLEHPNAKPSKPIIPNNIKRKTKEFIDRLFD